MTAIMASADSSSRAAALAPTQQTFARTPEHTQQRAPSRAHELAAACFDVELFRCGGRFFLHARAHPPEAEEQELPAFSAASGAALRNGKRPTPVEELLLVRSK